jgi:hypothetical protein
MQPSADRDRMYQAIITESAYDYCSRDANTGSTCAFRSGVVRAARVPTITRVHAAMSVVPMSAVVDIWEEQELDVVESGSCQIA